jgi:glycosyltransferase involved in cell wall biosynthesis
VTRVPAATHLRVALVHNRYRRRGGEDEVFEREAALIESAGHDVECYEVNNDATDTMSTLGVAARSIWNPATYRRVGQWFTRFRPDVVHVHNTLPLISPAVFRAARHSGATVIQTLHNYRMICPSATLFRDGRPCELCVGRAWHGPAVRYACYRGSRAASAVVAAGTFIHTAIGTYARDVDRYIALTSFTKEKLIEGGLPSHRIVVKPNFCEPPPATRTRVGTGVLFVGRLSEEKGVHTLVEAWRRHLDLPELRVAGDGPLRPMVQDLARSCTNVTALGPLTRADVDDEMRSAALLVFPSLCYETFGLTIVEAFSHGLPVVASAIGSVREIIEDEVSGLTFTPGDSDALASRVRRLVADHALNLEMGARARKRYEARYTPAANIEQIERIYREAMGSRTPARSGWPSADAV